LKGEIASAQNVGQPSNSRLDDGIVIRVTENGWKPLRQFHQNASRFEESQIPVDGIVT
jgi:hypothetical protein